MHPIASRRATLEELPFDFIVIIFTVTVGVILVNMSQEYSAGEVAQNNGRDGKPVWIIIKESVYDVTKFIKEVCQYSKLKHLLKVKL